MKRVQKRETTFYSLKLESDTIDDFLKVMADCKNVSKAFIDPADAKVKCLIHLKCGFEVFEIGDYAIISDAHEHIDVASSEQYQEMYCENIPNFETNRLDGE